jgi:Peptidase family M48
MARYVVAAALLLVYAAGSVWIVGREGRAYRDSLNRARIAARPSAPPTQPRPEPTADPEPAPVETSQTAEAPPVDTSPAERPVPKPAPEVAKAEIPRPAPPPAPRPSETPRPSASEPAIDPAWETPGMKRTWDVSSLKTDDEKSLGLALNELILSFHAKVEVGPLPRRVEETAEPFVKARKRKDIDYTFTVLDSDAVNAFSHPGGYVYVTRGLMDWIGEDQLFALEFILAHEIAHVDLQHALTCLKDPGVKKLNLGTLPKFLLLLFPRGYYPDKLDFDADRWAYQQMELLQRTKRERLAFLRKLMGYSELHGFENGRGKPAKPDEHASPIENHLRAHPAPYKRLKELETLTAPAAARAQ